MNNVLSNEFEVPIFYTEKGLNKWLYPSLIADFFYDLLENWKLENVSYGKFKCSI